MMAAKNAARRRLSATLEPSAASASAVDGAVERGAEAVGAKDQIRDDIGKVSAALVEINRLNEAGQLDEAKVAEFADRGASEQAICAVAVLAQLEPARDRADHPGTRSRRGAAGGARASAGPGRRRGR